MPLIIRKSDVTKNSDVGEGESQFFFPEYPRSKSGKMCLCSGPFDNLSATWKRAGISYDIIQFMIIENLAIFIFDSMCGCQMVMENRSRTQIYSGHPKMADIFWAGEPKNFSHFWATQVHLNNAFSQFFIFFQSSPSIFLIFFVLLPCLQGSVVETWFSN